MSAVIHHPEEVFPLFDLATAATALCNALAADRLLLAVLARPEHRAVHAAADRLRAALEGV
jgi:hypothetical protein